jgi:hypothetical protein
MCFSAQASFGTGAVLAVAGAISIKKVTRPGDLLFASIPLFFAVQQIAEGFLWLSLSHGKYDHWKVNAMNFFLFFAQVVWPVWVPLSIALLERVKTRKRILLVIACIGLFTSVCLAYFLLSYLVNAEVRDHHIYYQLNFPEASMKLSILYFIPTALPCFLSSYRYVRWMGLAVLASFMFSRLFFKEELISVWCFFAALISASILFIMHHIRKSRVPAEK